MKIVLESEQNIEEGFNKPGARGVIKYKTCNKCQGKGTPSLTLTASDIPCKNCKGTGKVWYSVPYPHQKKPAPYQTDFDGVIDEKTRKAIVNKDEIVDMNLMSDKEQAEFKKHVKNMPPTKVAHLAKTLNDESLSLTEMIKDVEKLYCPQCKMNVIPEPDKSGWKNACPKCRNKKLEPKVDEMSTVGAVGGYNAPLGSGYKTNKKGAKHNFRIREMKTFKNLVNETVDLSKFTHTLTALIDKKSKSGELQKQFIPPAKYSPDKFMKWLKGEAEKEGTKVSDEYFQKLQSRLRGNWKQDLKTVYDADLFGANLRAPKEKRMPDGSIIVNKENEMELEEDF